MIYDIIIIITGFTLFAFIHTYTTSFHFRNFLAEKAPKLLKYHRLGYNLISFITFGALWYFSPKPDKMLYDLSYPYDIIILIPQFIGLAGILWSASYFRLKEFIGIEQLTQNKENHPYDFIVKGPYKYVRHPIYTAFIIFLGFRPTMSYFDFLTFILITLYFYVGSIFEEKKLLKEFGESYQEYQKCVPRLIPVSIKGYPQNKNNH